MGYSRRLGILIAIALLGTGLISCFGESPTPTPRPAPTPRLVAVSTPQTPVAQPFTREPRPGTTLVNLDALAPPGTARDALILYCGNCHSFVCALGGQRTLEHWESVKSLHKTSRWVILPDRDYDFLFAYLEANFNDRKPVPDLPPALQGQGCTSPQR